MEKFKNELTKIAVFFSTTHGMPLEVFNDLIKEKTGLELVLFIRNFKRLYPKYLK